MLQKPAQDNGTEVTKKAGFIGFMGSCRVKLAAN
jgi:hypothetical protein